MNKSVSYRFIKDTIENERKLKEAKGERERENNERGKSKANRKDRSIYLSVIHFIEIKLTVYI